MSARQAGLSEPAELQERGHCWSALETSLPPTASALHLALWPKEVRPLCHYPFLTGACPQGAAGRLGPGSTSSA